MAHRLASLERGHIWDPSLLAPWPLPFSSQSPPAMACAGLLRGDKLRECVNDRLRSTVNGGASWEGEVGRNPSAGAGGSDGDFEHEFGRASRETRSASSSSSLSLSSSSAAFSPSSSSMPRAPSPPPPSHPMSSPSSLLLPPETNLVSSSGPATTTISFEEHCRCPVAVSAWHITRARLASLSEGSLAHAIGASAAVPGLFAPASAPPAFPSPCLVDGALGDPFGLAACPALPPHSGRLLNIILPPGRVLGALGDAFLAVAVRDAAALSCEPNVHAADDDADEKEGRNEKGEEEDEDEDEDEAQREQHEDEARNVNTRKKRKKRVVPPPARSSPKVTKVQDPRLVGGGLASPLPPSSESILAAAAPPAPAPLPPPPDLPPSPLAASAAASAEDVARAVSAASKAAAAAAAASAAVAGLRTCSSLRDVPRALLSRSIQERAPIDMVTLVLADTPSVGPFSMATAGPAAVAGARAAVEASLTQPVKPVFESRGLNGVFLGSSERLPTYRHSLVVATAPTHE